jgi:hypothetical protein
LETIEIHAIQKEPEGMAGHEELKDKPSQEDCTKMRRTIRN